MNVTLYELCVTPSVAVTVIGTVLLVPDETLIVLLEEVVPITPSIFTVAPVYNNEVVVKTSLNADNKTYSDSVTDLSNQITDIASGNIGTGNTTINTNSNGGSSIFNTLSDYYVIENTNNSSNSIVLPDNLITENNKTIRIFNKTGSMLTILSPVTIYSTFYAPNGTNALILPINSTVEMNYVYNSNGIQTIHASVF